MYIIKIRYVAFLGSSKTLPEVLTYCKEHNIYHEIEDLRAAKYFGFRYTIYLMSDLEPISLLMNANVYCCSLFTIDSRGRISKPTDHMQMNIRGKEDFTMLPYTTEQMQQLCKAFDKPFPILI